MLKITNITEDTYKALCDANQLKLIDIIAETTNIKKTGNNRYTCEFKCSLNTNLAKIIIYLYHDEYEGLDYWQKYNIQSLIKNNRYLSGDNRVKLCYDEVAFYKYPLLMVFEHGVFIIKNEGNEL